METENIKVKKSYGNSIGNYVLQVIHPNLPTLELLCEMYKDKVIKFEKREKVYGTE